MLNLNHLMIVLAVAEHGSVGRAAVALRLSQPAVSRTVKELERHVPEPAVETDSLTFVLAMVEATDLLTILPRAVVLNALAARRLAVVPAEWSPIQRLGTVLTLRGRERRPLLRLVVEQVRRACRELGVRLV